MRPILVLLPLPLFLQPFRMFGIFEPRIHHYQRTMDAALNCLHLEASSSELSFFFAYSCCWELFLLAAWAFLLTIRAHSCTRVRGSPVALHVSQQIPSESWGFSGVAEVSRYTPPPPQKRPCRACRPWTARGFARQAACEKVSRYRGCSSYTSGCRATPVQLS